MMSSEKITFLWRGIVAGLLIALVVGLRSVPDARGQAAAGEDSGWLMATGELAGGGSVCWLFDTRSMKLGAYVLRGKILEVGAVRLCSHDFRFKQFPKRQEPDVSTMEEQLKEAEKSAGKGGP